MIILWNFNRDRKIIEEYEEGFKRGNNLTGKCSRNTGNMIQCLPIVCRHLVSLRFKSSRSRPGCSGPFQFNTINLTFLKPGLRKVDSKPDRRRPNGILRLK